MLQASAGRRTPVHIRVAVLACYLPLLLDRRRRVDSTCLVTDGPTLWDNIERWFKNTWIGVSVIALSLVAGIALTIKELWPSAEPPNAVARLRTAATPDPGTAARPAAGIEPSHPQSSTPVSTRSEPLVSPNHPRPPARCSYLIVEDVGFFWRSRPSSCDCGRSGKSSPTLHQ